MSTKKTSPTNKSNAKSSSRSKEPNAISKCTRPLSYLIQTKLNHTKLLIISIGQMTEDINFMEFETRMRQLMRELLEPVIYKSKVDREMIFKLEKTDQNFESRIDLLE